MTARNGLRVEKRVMPSGKRWMFVATKEDGSPVAFEDWYYQVRVLVACEVEKYGGDPENPTDWERWGRLPKEFLLRCFDFEATYEALRAEFGLPR